MWEMPPEYAEYLERMKDPASMDKEVLESKFLALLKERVFYFIFCLLIYNLLGCDEQV